MVCDLKLYFMSDFETKQMHNITYTQQALAQQAEPFINF